MGEDDVEVLEAGLRDTADHVRARAGRMSIPRTDQLDCRTLLEDVHLTRQPHAPAP